MLAQAGSPWGLMFGVAGVVLVGILIGIRIKRRRDAQQEVRRPRHGIAHVERRRRPFFEARSKPHAAPAALLVGCCARTSGDGPAFDRGR